MLVQLTIHVSSDADIAAAGVVVARRGDRIAAVVSASLSRRQQMRAICKLLTDEEYEQVDWPAVARSIEQARAGVPGQRQVPTLLRVS